MNPITKKVLSQLFLVILVVLVLLALFFAGLFVGYVYFGKGSSNEVFNQETWQHIIEFVK
ncbi:DNA-directed RNA polymerase subunit beta [Vagococcus jeotgali]|uniref:DNA-directed RNA polymerase subunit beta n=1 Tax=Vagococcus jeotgali TaxID=3109030 RepID=UPI002DDBAD63|nr:DNA-directed RNA polymerase subunit beta [Vagococcus sp. B2T-5]